MIRFEDKEVTRVERVIVEATCDNCQAKLEPVFPDPGMMAQFQQALEVTISGGYGEFIDGMARLYLCQACAIKLGEAFPCIKKAWEGAIANVQC